MSKHFEMTKVFFAFNQSKEFFAIECVRCCLDNVGSLSVLVRWFPAFRHFADWAFWGCWSREGWGT